MKTVSDNLPCLAGQIQIIDILNIPQDTRVFREYSDEQKPSFSCPTVVPTFPTSSLLICRAGLLSCNLFFKLGSPYLLHKLAWMFCKAKHVQHKYL